MTTAGRGWCLRWAVLIAMVAALVSCTRARTEVVVEIDTDYPWGAGATLRSMQVAVRSNGPDGELRDRRVLDLAASASTTGGTRLPASFGVLPLDGDARRQVFIEVQGCGAAGCTVPLVTRRALVGFVEEQTVVLRMFLARACEGMVCTNGVETCDPEQRRCVSALVDVRGLPRYLGDGGSGPSIDATSMDRPAVTDDLADAPDAVVEVGADGGDVRDARGTVCRRVAARPVSPRPGG